MRRSSGRGLLQVLCGVFFFLLLGGSARAQVAQPEAEKVQPSAEVVRPRAVESGLVIVTAESAEVRTGPSTNAEVIAVVDKGEIFEKLGRTMRWYLVKVDDEITGYISGRYIRRYQEGGQSTYPSGGAYDGRNYPSYYPGDYYNYPYYNPFFYNYGWPYFSGEWYFYGGEPYRGYDRHPGGGWHGPNGYPGGGGGGPNGPPGGGGGGPSGYPGGGGGGPSGPPGGGGGGPHFSPMPMPHMGGGGFPHR